MLPVDVSETDWNVLERLLRLVVSLAAAVALVVVVDDEYGVDFPMSLFFFGWRPINLPVVERVMMMMLLLPNHAACFVDCCSSCCFDEPLLLATMMENHMSWW